MKIKQLVLVFLVLVVILFACVRPSNKIQVPAIPNPTATVVAQVVDSEPTVVPTEELLPTPVIEPTNIAPDNSTLANPIKANAVRGQIATRAAELAAKTMKGDYSWEEFRTCSTFVSAYMRQLSFPVSGRNGQYSFYPNPFPWSGTIEQVDWIKQNYPQYTYSAPLKDFLDGKLWDKISPADIIYLQTPVGHNGYNTYFHTVVLVSYDKDGQPVFAELASGMNNVATDRTFDEMTKFYGRDAAGNWKIEPTQKSPSVVEPELIITWFDPLAALNGNGKDTGLWQKSGPVTPNSPLLATNFDDLITINIFDGTATLWEQTNGVWTQVTVEGHSDFYAVVGRLLPANSSIEEAFLHGRKTENYDSDFGVYFSNSGVYQNTWTPQMLARLTGFQVVKDFGGLNGNTDTSLMTPQLYDTWGKLKDNKDYSSFTFHKIPDVNNQDMLLRADLLSKANTLGSPDFGPIPAPNANLSSGCINFDITTWVIIKSYLQIRLDSGHRVGVIFSYPNFDQNLLPTLDVTRSAFTGSEFNKWCPSDRCDGYDGRFDRKTYLDQNK